MKAKHFSETLRARPKNRTSVPFFKKFPTRWLVKAVDAVAPALTAKYAEQLYLTPPKFMAPPEEVAFLQKAHQFYFKVNGQKVAAWSWGDGPTVFLVHGWGGRAGQFHAFVEPLVKAGYSVIAFDAPGHGQSPGSISTLNLFALTLREAAYALGPAEAVIAHSMGGPATVLAIQQGLKVKKLVFIAPPISAGKSTQNLARHLGLSVEALARLENRLERRLGVSWESMSLVHAAPKMQTPLLVIHDQNDKQVPWQSGASLAEAWPNAKLLTTHGLGHTRIVRNSNVVHEAIQFVLADTSKETASKA